MTRPFALEYSIIFLRQCTVWEHFSTHSTFEAWFWKLSKFATHFHGHEAEQDIGLEDKTSKTINNINACFYMEVRYAHDEFVAEKDWTWPTQTLIIRTSQCSWKHPEAGGETQ